MKVRAFTLALPLAAALALPTFVSEDVLEPSVRNEVDHAIARAPVEAWTAATNVSAEVRGAAWVREDGSATNALSATAIALKLISTQGADGRWRCGTNDWTVTALRILRTL